MKVIYESVYDMIAEIYHESMRQERDVEKIILTRREWYDLMTEMNAKFYRPMSCAMSDTFTLMGITIEKEKCASC
jgi:hypothetical protein